MEKCTGEKVGAVLSFTGLATMILSSVNFCLLKFEVSTEMNLGLNAKRSLILLDFNRNWNW